MLPLITVIIISHGLIKKVKIFDCFVEGARDGIKTFVALLPPVTALIVGVGMLKSSGGLKLLTWLFAPLARFLGIPTQVIPLCLLSPVSGSGSLSMYETILEDYGVDSYAGRVASVIAGSTETTFYTTTVYYGAVGIKKIRYTLPCALIADLTSFVVSSLAVRVLF